MCSLCTGLDTNHTLHREYGFIPSTGVASYMYVLAFPPHTQKIGFTPLTNASHNGQVAVVEVLLTYDHVDIDATTKVSTVIIWVLCTSDVHDE